MNIQENKAIQILDISIFGIVRNVLLQKEILFSPNFRQKNETLMAQIRAVRHQRVGNTHRGLNLWLPTSTRMLFIYFIYPIYPICIKYNHIYIIIGQAYQFSSPLLTVLCIYSYKHKIPATLLASAIEVYRIIITPEPVCMFLYVFVLCMCQQLCSLQMRRRSKWLLRKSEWKG